MYESINEPIEVVASFGVKAAMPLKFRWRKRVYRIEKVNLVHKGKVGGESWYYFSVSDNANYFKLAFNSATLKWFLDEIFIEN